MGKIIPIHFERYAPVGSTIKVAYEQTLDGFDLGVIFPNGDPWVFQSNATSLEQLQREIEGVYTGRTVQYISIEEHNQLKAVYRQGRTAARGRSSE